MSVNQMSTAPAARIHLIRRSLLVVAGVAVLAALLASPTGAASQRGRYIVVLKDSVDHPASLAHTQTEQRDGKLGFIYRHALNGYSAQLSRGAVESLRRDPRVKYVEPDHIVEMDSQTVPTGISRVFATKNAGIGIDGKENARVDVDVAVIDSGVEKAHPDLNVHATTNCIGLEPESQECSDGDGSVGSGHGTHVGGIIGALDNGQGVTGIAPGARLWSARVFDDDGVGYDSWIIAAVDWVTEHADQIEVANMSLGCGIQYKNGEPVACERPLEEEAIEHSVEAGVVYVAAAGNDGIDAKYKTPARFPDVIAASNLADYDGKPGGESKEFWRPGCMAEKQQEGETQRGPDDTLTKTSNYGSAVDVAAPGSCILSTWRDGQYAVESGTSMSSPYVAGAAALLASRSNPESKEDVEAIHSTIVEAGNFDWKDTSGDGIQEPLLDVSDEEIFDPVVVHSPTVTTGVATKTDGTNATLGGTVNPNGSEASYQFEYGTSTEYGQTAPASPQSVGSGTEDIAVNRALEGLNPGTTYHFRVVASNASGTFYGADGEFTTWGEWSLAATANPKAQEKSSLADVACPTASSCRAVGYDEYRGRALFEKWNGSTWTITSSEIAERKPTAIACSAGAFCFAAGEKADGSPYTVQVALGIPSGSEQAPATPEGGSALKLKALSCPAGGVYTCTAVGTYSKEGKTKPLIERHSESSEAGWSLQASATTASEAELKDVSCPSTSECFAVGREGSPTSPKPLVERWNGSSWSVQSSPLPSGKSYASLSRVSCTSASACIATGNVPASEGGGAYAVRWNGKEWSLASSGLASGAVDLSCASSTFCIAAGNKEGKTLMQAWNGSEWATQSSPNPEGKTPQLGAASCASTTYCSTVGFASFGEGEKATLGEGWNGTSWSLAATANPKAQEKSSLADVACPTASSCRAVGYDEYRGRALFEKWNGSTWTITSSEIAERKPTAIACSAGAFCFAAGEKADGSPYTVQVALGIPSGSEQAPATPEGGSALKLKALSCPAGGVYTCTAVGTYSKEGKTKPLIERHSESSEAGWSLQASATTASEAELKDVSCPSTSECFAVGREGSPTSPKPLVERWNGSSWSVQSSPLPSGKSYASLSRVSCTSASACIATGNVPASEGGGAYAVRWNGKEWSLASSGLASGAVDLSCASSTFCIAAGNKEGKTLMQAWNGSEWATQSSPNPEGKTPQLGAASCASTTYCSTVGFASFGEGEKATLGEGYRPTVPTVVTKAATQATGESMSLNGTVNPNGSEASYQFEYGTSTEYGQTAPASPQSVGSGTEDVAVSKTIEGLNPATTYHFRLVASNKKGTTHGDDMKFTTWSLRSTPNPNIQEKSSLADVSCPAAGTCLAVGYDEYEGRSIAESWNGEAWAMAASEGLLEHRPIAVSCGWSWKCFVIGEKSGGSFYSQRWASVESFWYSVSEPALATAEGGAPFKPNSIGCPVNTNSYNCTAVGTYSKEGKTKPLIERYNGVTQAWALQSSATSAGEAELKDIHCPSVGECFAVGWEGSPTSPKPLVERWNGSSWSVQSSPLPSGKSYASLSRVSCTSAGTCVATGSVSSGEGGAPFALRWDGNQWSLASTGLVPSVSDVACPLIGNCIAVGTKEGKTLIQAWNGAEWSAQLSPNPEGKTPSLAAAACFTDTSCAAVGYASSGAGKKTTLGVGYR